MIKAFYIFKEGVTKDWVTILISIDDFTDELLKFKMEKYKYLGFQIKNI